MGGRGSKSGNDGTERRSGEKSEFDQTTEHMQRLVNSSLGYVRDSEEEVRYLAEEYANWESDYLDAQEQYDRLSDWDTTTEYERQEAEERLKASKEEFDRAYELLKDERTRYLEYIKDYDTEVDSLNDHLGRKSVGYYKPDSDELLAQLSMTRGWKTYHRKHRW